MLNYGRQWIDQDDCQAVLDVLNSDFLTQGPSVKKFEDDLAAMTGAKYAVAVSNGTAALHLAVAALNLEKNSFGVTTPITFAASSNAMIYNQLNPLFCDIDPETWCMSPRALQDVMNARISLITPVHFTGLAADMISISEIGQKYGAKIIEDAAHAIGTRYESGEWVGSCTYSDMTTFSFHPVKTITTGEGGAVTTNSEELYQRLVLLRNHGITKNPNCLSKNPGPWYYEMQDLGFNYRLTDIQAVLGSSQLRKLDMFVERRRDIIRSYNEQFANMANLETPYDQQLDHTAYHLYVVLIDYNRIGKTRAQVMEQLRELGVGTQVHYIPVYQLPYYQHLEHLQDTTLANAENYYERCLSLPLFPGMRTEDVTHVVQSVQQVVARS